jgi:uncharacterized protein (TIGR04255 family)
MGKRYKNPPLKNVIFRIDLAQPISQGKRLINEFYKIIEDDFPNREDISGIRIEATMGLVKDKEPSVKQFQRAVVSNKFSNADQTIILMFEPEPSNFNLLFKSYKNSEELRSLVESIVMAISKTYGNILIKRIGLRYINNIAIKEGDAFEWGSFINPHLISMIEFTPDKRKISRAIGRMELNKDTYNVQFYYGMANPEYPNAIARKEFILDYDCYSTEEININGVPDVVNALHDEIKLLFESSILDGLRDIIGVVSDE